MSKQSGSPFDLPGPAIGGGDEKPKKSAKGFVAIIAVVASGACLLACCGAGGVGSWVWFAKGDKQQAANAKDEAPKPPAKVKDGPAKQDSNEKVTRANFNLLGTPGAFQMLSNAETLLGPAREDSRFGNILRVSWRSRDGRCTIHATYEVLLDRDAMFIGKSIIGD
jgi:hypothetical protein